MNDKLIIKPYEFIIFEVVSAVPIIKEGKIAGSHNVRRKLLLGGLKLFFGGRGLLACLPFRMLNCQQACSDMVCLPHNVCTLYICQDSIPVYRSFYIFQHVIFLSVKNQ
jgi:hypothetical protein